MSRKFGESSILIFGHFHQFDDPNGTHSPILRPLSDFLDKNIYLAQALLLSRGLSFSSYAAVIAAFGKEFAKTGDLDVKFHRRLIDAQDARNMGDYGTGTGVNGAQVARTPGVGKRISGCSRILAIRELSYKSSL